MDAAVALQASERLPVGTELHVAEFGSRRVHVMMSAGRHVMTRRPIAGTVILGPKGEPFLVSELPEIAPLPAAAVGLAIGRPQQVEQIAKAADVVGVPGGQGQVGARRVQRLAQLLLRHAEARVRPIGVLACCLLASGGRQGGRPLRVGVAPFGTGRLQRLADPHVRPYAQSQQAGREEIDKHKRRREPRSAPRPLERAFQNNTGRATIGSSARNRLRSSPIASADWYRAFGSLSIAFKTIVSRSRGIRGSSDRGRNGSSVLISSTSLSRSEQSNPGRRVSNSYSVSPSA